MNIHYAFIGFKGFFLHPCVRLIIIIPSHSWWHTWYSNFRRIWGADAMLELPGLLDSVDLLTSPSLHSRIQDSHALLELILWLKAWWFCCLCLMMMSHILACCDSPIIILMLLPAVPDRKDIRAKTCCLTLGRHLALENYAKFTDFEGFVWRFCVLHVILLLDGATLYPYYSQSDSHILKDACEQALHCFSVLWRTVH